MPYYLFASLGLAALYGESIAAVNREAATPAALITLVLSFLSLYLPPRILRFTLDDAAAVVLTRLMTRGALGSGSMLLMGAAVWLVANRPTDPVLLGEVFVFTLVSVLLFQAWGGVIAHHVMYLQATHQYNSNQLAAVILLMTSLLFVLVLYFVAFDLARPPDLHAYVRDILAVSVTLLGFGRAVYLMAHH